MKKLLIVDGHGLLFRAFYGVPATMTLKDGRPINAVYGLISQLFSALDICKPDYFALCFDRPEPTFRDAIYTDYKAHRPPPPQELLTQFEILPDIIEGLGLPTFEKPGFEADDIMGTLANKMVKDHIQVFLLTGDMDILQLATDQIHILKPGRGKPTFDEMGPRDIAEQYGITPKQIIDYKALKGDSSDNIPGVKGIGDKTAITLLRTYDDLDVIYANLDKITPPGVQAKLRADKEMAYLSRRLATLDCNVPLEFSESSLEYKPDWQKILALFTKYDFKSLVQRYRNKVDILPEAPPKQVSGTYRLVETVSELEALLPALQNGFAIDLETTSLNAPEAQIVGVSLSVTEGEGYYIALNAFLEKQVNEVSIPLFASEPTKLSFKPNLFLKKLAPLLENPSIPKYAHNGKYEYLVLRNYGVELQGLSFDTMIAAFLLHPLEKIGLKELVNRQFGVDMTTYEEVAGTGKTQVNFADVPIEAAVQYASADADFTFRLQQLFSAQLDAKPGLKKLFIDIEMPIIPVLGKMEYTGVNLDRSHLAVLSNTFQKRLAELRIAIVQLAGCDFNLSSPKQVGEILFEKLQLPVIKKTKTGVSTDASVLEKLKNAHPIIEKMLEYRTLEKLMSTYVTALPAMVSPVTGRIHTSFNQTIAATGRLSSTNPNLQNIPIRTEEGRQIRGAFVPSTVDGVILSADYSQIELRLLAHFSQDPHMLEAFQNHEDIHVTTAAIVNHIPKDQVTKEQRAYAKSVNFGIIYGISEHGLSEQLGISRKDAKEIIDTYFSRFSKIKEFMSTTLEEARKTGYVTTEFGRIRPLPEINSSNFNRRQFAERIAVNTRMQGTAADIIKIAMIRCQERLEKEGLKSKMVIQVHDELVFDVVKNEQDRVVKLVKEEMERAVSFSVPLEVDTEVGKNWQETS